MSRSRSSGWRRWLALILIPLGSAHATGAGYRYDTVHSQIVFSVSHDGYSRPFGRLHIAKGWLRFDPNDWSTAATELDIDLDSLDMGDADWNKAVCKPDLLDCTDDRHAHFVSTLIERKDARHGVLHGQLRMRGTSQSVSIPFTFNRAGHTIYGMHEVAGFSATTMLDRDAYGMTAYPGSIGHQVSVWLELEAIRDDHAVPPSKEQP
jgi:polyisoprenoid-binding protein YceI